MAVDIESLRRHVEAPLLLSFERLVSRMRTCGLPQVIDLALLDDDDLRSVVEDEPSLFKIGSELLKIADGYRHGWAKLVNMPDVRPSSQAVGPTADATSSTAMASSSRSTPPSSMQRLQASFRTHTMRVAFGLVRKQILKKKGVSMADLKKDKMEHALDKVHAVFVKHAGSSPRFMALRDPSEAMLDMQRQSYRMGSRSAAVVAGRARAANHFFLDIATFRWRPETMTPFQTATWVRSRVRDGQKTAAVRAGSALHLVQYATDWDLHLSHPIVQCQVKPKAGTGDIQEEPQGALTPSVEMIKGLERLITTGATPQIRCIAGFFVCLTFASARASDTQASKDLKLLPDAVGGVALLKNKKTWTKWFCSRQGLCGDWASSWMEELAVEGLPGTDFILLAPNSSYDQWLDRPAEYADFRRAVHFLLGFCLNLPLEEAVLYNPHSFRHFLIESSQQLRAMKFCTTDDVERLGRWKPGSGMPDVYDNQSGVSDLISRHRVISALVSGWRPVTEGQIPEVPVFDYKRTPGGVDQITLVANRGSSVVHRKAENGKSTFCRMWTCGTPGDPSKSAMFTDVPDDWKRCRPCGLSSLGKPQ